MRHARLTKDQSAANSGFTDLFVITHDDLTDTTDTADQTLTLDTLDFGDIVGYEAVIEIVTAFAGGTADNALTVALGVTSATTQFIGASALYAGGTPTAAKVAYGTASGGAPYATPSGGKSLLATFDITDADGDMEDYTAGEIRIWMKISRWQERANITA